MAVARVELASAAYEAADLPFVLTAAKKRREQESNLHGREPRTRLATGLTLPVSISPEEGSTANSGVENDEVSPIALAALLFAQLRARVARSSRAEV